MIKRKLYLDKLEMYLHRNVVKIITGVRRCGKTTLIKQFISELLDAGVPEPNIIYFNLESMIYSYVGVAELRDMIAAFVNSASGHCYIFLDEVERVENWTQVASELLNLFDCDLYVTSSNASIYRGNFAAVLAYRYVKIDVYPLTFSEYLMFTAGEYGHRQAEGEPVYSKEELFADYLHRGCMPGAYALRQEADAYDYFSALYSSIILKDVVQCNNLRDISHLDKIVEYLLSHMGELFSPKAIKDFVKSHGVTISVDTVYSCLDALTDSYLIYKIPRFDIKADRELETQEKYYICDMRLRDAVMYDEGVSREALLENVLCLELLSRGFRLYVGKHASSQVDFMAVRGQDRTYLNCCESVADKEAVKKEFGPLTRIKDNYFKMVLSMDPSTIINKGGIINFPLISFLSEG